MECLRCEVEMETTELVSKGRYDGYIIEFFKCPHCGALHQAEMKDYDGSGSIDLIEQPIIMDD